MKTLKDELLARASGLDESAKRYRDQAASSREEAERLDADAANSEQRAAEYRTLAEKA